ncbi:magnesium/cobalt transporter CorA [Luteolibacter ambystomatis]|uniref:Magnesium transport protein CorA n=2 Tax=Luteolibacter ambystomatis TaxID=2824561 RepID=A0A975G8S1_9BACT|nr:magnesium/cobalt transporter CorA [Luteolibacter ambystomatis]QUE51174.1 magnesium/cobalt transporter CorA [Luteolibacter ambystomatis]
MFEKRYSAPGSSPATLLPHLVDGKTRKPRIQCIEYDAGHFEEREITDIQGLISHIDNHKITWINVDGLGDVEALQTLAAHFDLHPLALEDALNTGQRPKTEQFPGYLFIVAQMVYQDKKRNICGEQVSFFLGDHFLITVQEEADYDVFNPVRDRLRAGMGPIRKSKADYLAYALLDSIIDHYYPVLECISESIEELEDDLLEKPSRQMVLALHEHKRSLTQLRRLIWPLRDVVNGLLHDASGQIAEPTKVFLRDCYDHTVQLMDLVESYKDITSGLMDLYHSSVGLRTNEIMRVLTVITSIFIPLTFIVGVYGMNFAPDPPAGRTLPLNMPELYHPYGYIGVMTVMAVIAAIQLWLFKWKKWL